MCIRELFQPPVTIFENTSDSSSNPFAYPSSWLEYFHSSHPLIMSSDQMQDLARSRINERDLQYIDIQTGGVASIEIKCRTIDATRMRANGRGREVVMRLQELSSLDIHSKRSKKAPRRCVRQLGEDEKSVGRCNELGG